MATSFALFAILACCPLALSSGGEHDDMINYIRKIQEAGRQHPSGVMVRGANNKNHDLMNKCFYDFNVEFARSVADFFVDQYYAYSQFFDKENFEKNYSDLINRSAQDKFYPVAFDINAFSRTCHKNIDEAAKVAEESVQRGQRRYFRSFNKFYHCIDQFSRMFQ